MGQQDDFCICSTTVCAPLRQLLVNESLEHACGNPVITAPIIREFKKVRWSLIVSLTRDYLKMVRNKARDPGVSINLDQSWYQMCVGHQPSSLDPIPYIINLWVVFY